MFLPLQVVCHIAEAVECSSMQISKWTIKRLWWRRKGGLNQSCLLIFGRYTITAYQCFPVRDFFQRIKCGTPAAWQKAWCCKWVLAVSLWIAKFTATMSEICALFWGIELLAMQVLATLACLSWMAVSSGLILVNKYIMSTDKFHFPMALSGLGMLFSSIASFLVCKVSLILQQIALESINCRLSFVETIPSRCMQCNAHIWKPLYIGGCTVVQL